MRFIAVLVMTLPIHFGVSQTSTGIAQIRVILDTDTFNEMDDQFFVTYALMETKFQVEGICATQYRVTEASVDESYYEARRILNLMGMSSRIPLYMGSDLALPDSKTPRPSPASRFILERAQANDPRPLHILAVGALTNVASAYLQNPEIRKRIRIIWLGGSKWPEGALTEFNAVNDRAAVKCILEAGLDLTQIPTETCARQLTTTFKETERRLRHRSPIGDYLIDLYRDYGHDEKVIWDMTAVACLLQQTQGRRFFNIERVKAPFVDQTSLRYDLNPNGAEMQVCTRLDRDAIFADFYSRFPAPQDFDPPYLALASSRGDLRSVTLTFNEDVDPASTRPPSNYRFAPEATVQSAEIADPRTVRLRMLDDLDPATNYRVTCTGVRDDSPVRHPIGPRNSFTFRPYPKLRDGLQATLYPLESDLRELPGADLRLRALDLREQVLDLWITDEKTPFIKLVSAKHYLVILEGNLEAPIDHEYEIAGYVGGALRVELDGRKLFELDARAGAARSSARRLLKRGLHPIRLTLLQRPGARLLNLYWSFPFHEKTRIAWNYLCSEKG